MTPKATAKRQRNINTVRAAETLMMGKFDQRYPLRLICECCDAMCRELIEVKRDRQDLVKRPDNVCYIKPGHENLALERVVHKEPKFYLVEKLQL